MNNDLPLVAIAGFGLEGRVLYEYFRGKAAVHIFDERALAEEGIEAEFHQSLTIPTSFPVVYKSPGIPTHKLIIESKETRISTFMELVLEKVGARAIGVTGTKGKSTVASLIYHALVSVGKDAVLLGNIGIADADVLHEDAPGRTYVLELSSYQCEHLTRSPHIAVLNNFFEEHLSHHGSLGKYREAKLNIARFQTAGDIFVNGSDLSPAFAGRIIAPDFSLQFLTKLAGEHNQRNCAVAHAALTANGFSDAEIRKAIETFEPLPYRLESVGEFKGITFYDDSLATIPEATEAAIQALAGVDTLILGGENRGISFDAFARFLAMTNIKTFIVFPDTGPLMVANVSDRIVIPVTNMEEAVKHAYKETPKGGTVLLSNASPSFNLFKDYKDKSAQYRKWIVELGRV